MGMMLALGWWSACRRGPMPASFRRPCIRRLDAPTPTEAAIVAHAFAVAHQPALIHVLPEAVEGGQTVLRRQRHSQ